MEITGKTLSGVTEVIDGNQYFDCRFENCTMVYRGGEIPHITGCQFDGCGWHFEGAAERTLVFMSQLYHGMGAGGRQLIEATINQIRQAMPATQQPAEQSPVTPEAGAGGST